MLNWNLKLILIITYRSPNCKSPSTAWQCGLIVIASTSLCWGHSSVGQHSSLAHLFLFFSGLFLFFWICKALPSYTEVRSQKCSGWLCFVWGEYHEIRWFCGHIFVGLGRGKSTLLFYPIILRILLMSINSHCLMSAHFHFPVTFIDITFNSHRCCVMLYPFYRSGNWVRGIEKMAERLATVVCHNWVGTQICLIRKSVFFFPTLSVQLKIIVST